MKTFALLAAVLLLALGLALWWSTDRSTTEPVSAPHRAGPPTETRAVALERPLEMPSNRNADPADLATPASSPPTVTTAAPTEPPYEQWTLEDLIREEKSLRTALNDKSSPLLQAEIDAGRAEFLRGPGPGTYYTSRAGDNEDVFAITSIPDRGVFRSSLARAQYPEIYAIKDSLLRVNRLIGQRETAAALPR